MTGAEFSVLGSLYFKRDLPSETRRTSLRLIEKDGVTKNDNGYCIGPSVNRRFWRGKRARMQTDRDPCTFTVMLTFATSNRRFVTGDSLTEYTQAVIAWEI